MLVLVHSFVLSNIRRVVNRAEQENNNTGNQCNAPIIMQYSNRKSHLFIHSVIQYTAKDNARQTYATSFEFIMNSPLSHLRTTMVQEPSSAEMKYIS